ncbi:major facilitator superfamily domain-containing protein [Collybia nuda]|uniref:Major facilitator superfamily domain-containing protein n=1 Tax=Collybia nuda TaxID=64659 RepID=A0A9P5Y3A8_9AGAR|nr:major facilitator superfamily domain-containing protein [Collybia nuda]
MSLSYGACDCPLCVPSTSEAPTVPTSSGESNAQPQPQPQPEPEPEPAPELEPEPVVVTPLPKLQLSVVACNHIAETVASTVIHPFVNDLVRNIGVANGHERKTGYYVGAVESVFYAAQGLTFIHWNRAAESVGRKPMMLGGTLGIAVSMMGFGLSNSFAGVLLSRCAQGAFNGNIGVTSSVMTEITDPTNAAQAFSFIPIARSIGATLGPLIGGILVNPAKQWPDIFGSIKLLKEYPYLLPCLIATAIPLAVLVFGSVGLKETLPSLIERKRQLEALIHSKQGAKLGLQTPDSPLLPSIPSPSQAYGAITDYVNHKVPTTLAKKTRPDPKVAISQLVATATSINYHELLLPRVFLSLFNYALLAFLDQSVLVLIPLIYSTPVHLGGLSLTPAKIGSILGFWGSANGFLQAYCFAWFHRHLGQRSCYMLGLVGLFACFALFPIISKFVEWDGGKIGCWVWLGVSLQLVAYMLSHMSYACISMYIAVCAPSEESAKSINSLSQMGVSGARSLAPSISSPLFAFSLELYHDRGYDLGEYFVHAVLCTLSLMALGSSFYLPKTLEDEKGKKIQDTE